jgi:hypothetical protein
MDVSVTPNAKIMGSISGVPRQIDVLIDARWEEGAERRIIFDAKLRKRKVDVKDVESFEGMMRDVRASRGVLLCSSGYTKAALARAQQSIEIRIVTTDEAAKLDLKRVACEQKKSWSVLTSETSALGALLLWATVSYAYASEEWQEKTMGVERNGRSRRPASRI